MSLACSEAEVEFYFLKYFLTSYSPSTQFLAFRSIWGFWKWSQMIPHITKHWFSCQTHVSRTLRSWVRISLLEVLLDLLQPLHPVLGLAVRSGASENGPKWFPISQNIGFVTRTMSVACSEAELEFHFLKYFLTSYSPSTQFLAFRSIWGLWKWFQMIPQAKKPGVWHQNHVSRTF